MTGLQFAVIGAGNMGCVYGGHLARVGEEVALVDVWPEQVEQISLRGLEMDGLLGRFLVRVCATTNPADVPKSDIALICVNTYSTRQAAESARSILKDSGYAVTLQNGVGNVEILTEVLGRDRVLAGLSFQSGDLQGPGKIFHTNNGPTYLGELDGSRTKRLAVVADAMHRAGMNPVVVDDVIATIWAKFVHNCGINAICAITGLRPGHIRAVPELDEFQKKIVEETLAMVGAKGINLPEACSLETIREYCAKKFHRPSMMQHLDRGRLTEIDALNGYVAKESARLGLCAPYNDALTRLIKGREQCSSHAAPE